MNYGEIKSKLSKKIIVSEVEAVLKQVRSEVASLDKNKVCKECFKMLDLTSLSVTDSVSSITTFTKKCIDIPVNYPEVGNVASICVSPLFVETVGIQVGDSPVEITSVAGGFPMSQTFLEVKALEVAMAVENGADEIDVVINVGDFLDGNCDLVCGELEVLREEIGGDNIMKVIIESGALPDYTSVREASLIAIGAGADFVKTSTGKYSVGATPQAAIAICSTIKDYYDLTAEKIGFKVAGGISNVETMLEYYAIVKNILGAEWLNSDLFRIGASSLADTLLSEIYGKKINYFSK